MKPWLDSLDHLKNTYHVNGNIFCFYTMDHLFLHSIFYSLTFWAPYSLDFHSTSWVNTFLTILRMNFLLSGPLRAGYSELSPEHCSPPTMFSSTKQFHLCHHLQVPDFQIYVMPRPLWVLDTNRSLLSWYFYLDISRHLNSAYPKQNSGPETQLALILVFAVFKNSTFNYVARNLWVTLNTHIPSSLFSNSSPPATNFTS